MTSKSIFHFKHGHMDITLAIESIYSNINVLDFEKKTYSDIKNWFRFSQILLFGF